MNDYKYMTLADQFDSFKEYGYVLDADPPGTINHWDSDGQDHRKQSDGSWPVVGSKEDKVGNEEPETDEDGDIVQPITDFNEISENDFLNPTKSYKLPSIKTSQWQTKINDNRPVLLKKWRMIRNRDAHKEIKKDGLNHKDVLLEAIYNADKVLYTQPQRQPFYRASIRSSKDSGILLETKNCVVLLDIDPNKKYIEVVDWREINDYGVRKMERQELKNNAVEDGLSLYNVGRNQAQPTGFLSSCINSNITQDTAEVKSLSEMFLRLKRLY